MKNDFAEGILRGMRDPGALERWEKELLAREKGLSKLSKHLDVEAGKLYDYHTQLEEQSQRLKHYSKLLDEREAALSKKVPSDFEHGES